MLENRSIHVLAYNMVTVLAEKLETVIVRADQNTRLRDYYDIYILTNLGVENIDPETLALALDATAKKRGSAAIVKQYRNIIESVRNSKMMNRQWENYRKEFDYAADIEFGKTCDAVVRVMDGVQRYLWG